MAGRRILWQLYTPILTLTIVVLLALGLVTSQSYRQTSLAQVQGDLHNGALLLKPHITPLLDGGEYDRLETHFQELTEQIDWRLTVILADGTVVADTDHDLASMDNHADRDEVAQVVEQDQQVGQSIRYSDTLNLDMMYVAVPMESERGKSVLRISVPMTLVNQAQRQYQLNLLIGGVAITVLAALFGLQLSSRLSQPLIQMKRGAERYAKGHLDKPLPIPRSQEMASLAEAMNKMATQLNERFRTIQNQQQELEALLSSMNEGMLAVDPEMRIRNVNRALRQLFEIHEQDLRGKKLDDVLDMKPVVDLFADTRETRQRTSREFEFIRSTGERFNMSAYGSPWLNSDGQLVGVVIVVSDITHLSKLETIRKDFVANVSHELKTPITSIKGYAETLVEGAYKDQEDCLRFLNIIAKQATRLQTIIEDLLDLSRMEQGKDEFKFAMGSVRAVVESAIETCQLKAVEKEIEFVVDGEEDITAPMNPALLEQAVVNLLTNAIKYSDEDSRVVISLKYEDGNRLGIHVHDEGIGIPEEKLPRLYERFYRVDKARSRKMGSTGLGLAIVKHIAILHKGTVGVVSEAGKGSTFSIYLPLKREDGRLTTLDQLESSQETGV